MRRTDHQTMFACFSSLLPSKPIELTYGEVKIKAMAWAAWKADMV
jgi:hypothetical protein